MSNENKSNRVIFTEEMKKTHTILVPNMLPIHFQCIAGILQRNGYRIEVLNTSGRHIIEKGLRYVHNDACYPAILVIGQLLDALESGKYDVNKTAVMIMQTGGGCRASNYISMLRKALGRAGLSHIPVISFNLLGIEKNPGFKLTLPLIFQILYAILYGDLIMTLVQRSRPYEKEKGAANALAEEWTDRIASDLQQKGSLSYRRLKKNFVRIVHDFEAIERSDEKKVKVGIVGEIYVKFSPLGNNNLEDFLVNEGAEAVMPGLLDFCLYYVSNYIYNAKQYGINKKTVPLYKLLYKAFSKCQKDLIFAISENSRFDPPTPFKHTHELVKGYMGYGAQMGEGWLLTAEMLELIESGTSNIICTQPFGCLPNHIVGKGVMKRIRENYPTANIVAIDYDPGSTAINQENRIKLMLANAERQREK